MKRRYLQETITKDLKDRMVFVGGPRQVGKTTMAKMIGAENYKKCAYLNWDSRKDRIKIMQEELPADAQLLIFDEIHKYRNWKNYLKGFFDKERARFNFLVTGSARLDIYRRGGDSLFGRYRYYRLHPFSLREALGESMKLSVGGSLSFLEHGSLMRKTYNELRHFGGFPEPFIKKQDAEWRRFQNERIERIIKEDIRDIEHIHDLSTLQILVELLPNKVGSLLSLNSLREDLQVNHGTVVHWMEVLEKFYYHFRIYPFAATKIKSLRKQPKLYLWDWSEVSDDGGARLENLVASHLLKAVHFLYDAYGYKAELNFLRDLEGREVDFLLTIDKKPWMAVEVKEGKSFSFRNLSYFGEKLKIPFLYQLVNTEGVDFYQKGIRLISVDKFLSGLV